MSNKLPFIMTILVYRQNSELYAGGECYDHRDSEFNGISTDVAQTAIDFTATYMANNKEDDARSPNKYNRHSQYHFQTLINGHPLYAPGLVDDAIQDPTSIPEAYYELANKIAVAADLKADVIVLEREQKRKEAERERYKENAAAVEKRERAQLEALQKKYGVQP